MLLHGGRPLQGGPGSHRAGPRIDEVPVSHVCSLSDPGCGSEAPSSLQRPRHANTLPTLRRGNTQAPQPAHLWARPQPCQAHSPAEAQPPLTCATGPPGELQAGSRRQLPPPLALMSSSGFGNFQSSQECLLKCSRSREQKEQNGALRPPFACKKQSAVTQTGCLRQAEEMDVASGDLYHPKGKGLLNHRELGESRDRGCRDLMML